MAIQVFEKYYLDGPCPSSGDVDELIFQDTEYTVSQRQMASPKARLSSLQMMLHRVYLFCVILFRKSEMNDSI